MQLVRWSFMSLHMPMMQNGEGNLYCTNKPLCDGLRISEDTLRAIRKRNADEFDGLSVTKCNAKAFFSANKTEFGIFAK